MTNKHDCIVPGCKECFIGSSGAIHWCGKDEFHLRKRVGVEPDWHVASIGTVKQLVADGEMRAIIYTLIGFGAVLLGYLGMFVAKLVGLL
jgi:hypothetical protein